MRRRQFTLAGIAGVAALSTAACAAGAGARQGADPGAPDGTGSTGGAGSHGGTGGAGSGGGFPLELSNCEAELVLEAAPQRIVLLESAPVTALDGIGVLEKVVARAGAFPPGYYDEDLTARIEAIPALSEDIDASGHLQISQEVVIAQSPDLVFGLPDGITRAGMADAGAQVMVQETYCDSGDARASFESLHGSVETCGRIFGRAADAEALNRALRERIETISAAAAELPPLTAAVLYPSIGGGPLYTYGAGSMVTAQLDALGVENAFAGSTERVFEISAEPLLAADPDVLIVLHQDAAGGDGAGLAEEMITQDQLSGLRAVREGAVLPLLFNFCEPASPLVVDGLERIHDWLTDLEGHA